MHDILEVEGKKLEDMHDVQIMDMIIIRFHIVANITLILVS